MPGRPVRLGGAVVEIAPNWEGRVVTIGEEVDLLDNRTRISEWKLVRVETPAAWFLDAAGVEHRIDKEKRPTVDRRPSGRRGGAGVRTPAECA